MADEHRRQALTEQEGTGWQRAVGRTARPAFSIARPCVWTALRRPGKVVARADIAVLRSFRAQTCVAQEAKSVRQPPFVERSVIPVCTDVRRAPGGGLDDRQVVM